MLAKVHFSCVADPEFARALAATGRKLVVVGATDRLLNMLKATKVDQLFTFASTVDEARTKI